MPVDTDVVHSGIEACSDIVVFALGEDDVAAIAASREGLEDVGDVICLVASGVYGTLQASIWKGDLLDARGCNGVRQSQSYQRSGEEPHLG
jgi:hypothetical protein